MLAATLLASFASNAVANTITISGNNDYRAGSGGEFNVRAADANGAALLAQSLGSYVTTNGTVAGIADGTLMNAGFAGQFGFQTFCIEFNEHITLGGTYAAAISNGSTYGGVAGGIDHDGNAATPTTDLISVGAAYLYSQFVARTLPGYNYANGSGRAASAVMLQQAFWYLEDEILLTATQKTSNVFLTAAITLFGDGTGIGTGGAKANNTTYAVGALNLGGNQDQLIMLAVPDVITLAVPEAITLAVPDVSLTATMLAFALSGLALLRRRSS